MNPVEIVFSKPLFQAVGWSLIHFIWQGTLVAMVLSSANVFLKNRSANARYVAACGALFLMLALPVGTAISYYAQPVELPFSLKPSQPVVADTSDSAIQQKRAIQSEGVFPATQAEPLQPSSVSLLQIARDRLIYLMPWFVAIWAIGVFALSLRFVGGMAMMRKMRRSETNTTEAWLQERVNEICAQIRISRPVVVCQSLLVEVPTVIGWLKPMILLPASSLIGLSSQQLEALLVHELAHIRRYDYLVNILQTTVETLLFYHPAVWWASQQVREEREHCCDDLAVAVCGDVLVYARALADLEQLRAAGPGLAMGANGGTLLRRIQRLIGSPAPASRRVTNWAAGLFAVVTVFALLASAHTSAIASKITAMAKQESKSSAADKGQTSATNSSQPVTATSAKKKTEDSSSQTQITTATKSESADHDSGETTQDTNSGHQGDYIDQLTAEGYTNLTVDELITLKNAGVTGEFIREMNAANGGKLTVRELISLRNSGVTSKYIRDLHDLGYDKLTIKELKSLAVQGVNPEYIRKLNELGYLKLSPSELTSMSIQGVNPEFIRKLNDLGYTKLSPQELVSMSIQGVNPDFIKALRDVGYDHLTVKELISMSIQGVSPAYIRKMKDLGYNNLTPRELVSMRIQGVTPEFVKEMGDLGYKNLNSEQLVSLSVQGVNPKYVKDMRDAGYSNLTVRDLIRLRTNGVTPIFIRKAVEHGFKDLSVEQLIRLMQAGIL